MKILLVDDDPLILRTYGDGLRSRGFQVERAEDGLEAAKILHRAKPDAIVLDLMMPKLSGLEVLERIRAHESTKLIPTVILTSSKQEEDLLEGYRLGVNSYVRKPVDFNEFVEAVRQVGLYWLVLNEVPSSSFEGGM